MEKIIRNKTIGELSINIEARCENLKVMDINVSISGDGISINRTYWDDGSYAPTQSASRLTNSENQFIYDEVMAIYNEFGVYELPNIEE